MTVDLFQFTDYRSFLKAYAEQVRKTKPGWSYGAWARHLGLSGASTLTMLVNGQRHPGKDLTDKLVRFFKFSPQQKEYFQNLIRLQKVKGDPGLSVLIMEQISRSHPDGQFRLLDVETFEAISYWYYYAIREMTLIDDFQENPEWIATHLRFKVTPREIKRAIQVMLKLNLLERNKAGMLRPASGTVDTRQDVSQEAVKRFHEQMIENARESVRTVPITRRELNGTTLVLPKKNIPLAKELIRKFQNDFCTLVEATSGEAVYQLNIQLFPLTQTEKEI